MIFSDLKTQSDQEIKKIQKNYICEILEYISSQEHLYRDYILTSFFNNRVFLLNAYSYLDVITANNLIKYSKNFKINHSLIKVSDSLNFDIQKKIFVTYIYNKAVDIDKETNLIYKEIKNFKNLDLASTVNKQTSRIKFNYNKKFLHYMMIISFEDNVDICYLDLKKYIPEFNVTEECFNYEKKYILNQVLSDKCEEYFRNKKKNHTFRGFCRHIKKNTNIVNNFFPIKDFTNMHNSFKIERTIQLLEK